MNVRGRVCRGCKILRRKLFKVRLPRLIWTFCGLFLFYVLIIWVMEEEESIPMYDYKLHRNRTRREVMRTNNPAIIWWNEGYRLRDGTINCPNSLQCEVFSANYVLGLGVDGAYLFYGSRLEFGDLPLPRNPRNVLWALTHEESPKNVPEFLHEAGLNLFNFSSTFSRHSDVPYPLQTLESLDDITNDKHFVKTIVKNELSKELAPIIYMSSSCYTFSDRDNYVKELMKHIPIDSYGSCLNNKNWPEDFPKDYLNNLNDGKILDFVARYKFAIAIENGVCEDYVTEKFWRPIKLGVVPIYFGSPSIRDWFPNNKSAILIEDFPTPKLLSEYLYELLKNDKLYEEYLEHKTKRLISNKRIQEELNERPYQIDLEKTSLHFECFVCEKLHLNRAHPTVNIVTKRHYNCSEPISALTKEPIQSEIPNWTQSKRIAESLYRKVQLFS